MPDTLKDKVAIVTGSGQGIGKAIAKVFAAHGASLVVATRTEKYGRETVDEITAAGGEASLCTADVGKVADIERIVTVAIETYGKIDIMVQNAGIVRQHLIEDLPEQDWNDILNVNLTSAYRLAKACLPHLRAQGGGRLLFTSSVTGNHVVMPGNAHYAASKGGLNGFIRAAAIEFAGDGITVNGVEPGLILTPALDSVATLEQQQSLAQFIPMKKLGQPEDVAYAMLFLASGAAGYITGQTIIVDGGALLPENGAVMLAE
ncbi:MAG TPA: SDR family oxidoreductase [Pseudomonadales bacterium]|nr:3-ketoacyl-ACP reductase [Gammaproteobacteria bacterium]MDP6025423.1 SDR family oxidoreductase [Pseudomonadales bacterium]MDP7452773.1 SDR family oxidoreductase [Arenicellales bacterium]MDP6316696.1 SDR family oxidoreductase [Pseudomonadales bacterium]MDP7313455.1 SDR family oxidoreductase [Pseudomonadales bacterium]